MAQCRSSGSEKRKAIGNSDTAARTMSGSFLKSAPSMQNMRELLKVEWTKMSMFEHVVIWSQRDCRFRLVLYSCYLSLILGWSNMLSHIPDALFGWFSSLVWQTIDGVSIMNPTATRPDATVCLNLCSWILHFCYPTIRFMDCLQSTTTITIIFLTHTQPPTKFHKN